MLPKELTASQEKLPDLNSAQLQSLGCADNFRWKLNARMLGFTEGMDVDDLIEEKIQTNPKGEQVIFFYFHETPAHKLPIALSDEFVLRQRYQMKNGEWLERNNCVLDVTKLMLILQSPPEDATDDYIIIYGKVVQSSVTKKTDSEHAKAMANITKGIKEINRVEKEQEFRAANKQTKKYRVASHNILK